MEMIRFISMIMQASLRRNPQVPISPPNFSSRGRWSHGWASPDINKIVCTPDDEEEVDDSQNFSKEEAWWALQPKKGGYYGPECDHKWIEDVNNRKTVDEEEQTHWFRSSEDVQKPPHDIDINAYISSD